MQCTSSVDPDELRTLMVLMVRRQDLKGNSMYQEYCMVLFLDAIHNDVSDRAHRNVTHHSLPPVSVPHPSPDESD